MAGFFSGVGRALGSAGVGFGLGQRQGEQEAYNRFKTDQLLNAKLALEHHRQPKEDVPYPIKSLLDTNKAVYASGNHQAINDWEASGHADTARQVERAYAIGGPTAATRAFSIVTQPKGTDVSGQLAAFDEPSDIPVGFGPRPQPQPAGSYDFLHPAIDPNFKYTPSAKENAQTGLIGAQQYQIEALTPENVARIRAQTQDIHDQFGLQQRQQNAKLAQDTFNNALKKAQFLTATGQRDLALQSGIYQQLLDAAGHLAVRGVDTSKALIPLLFNTEVGGAKPMNPQAVSLYLQQQGLNPEEINRILAGGNVRAGGGALGLAPPGAAGGVVPGFAGPVGGGVPVLNQVGGIGPPTANPQLAGAQQFTTGQGFTVTSTTGGRHNTGSAHYQGRAIDVGVRNKSPQETKAFMAAAQQAGFTVRDERTKPKGQKVWSGPHVHLEWGKQGPPAALPGMTQEQVAGLLAPDAGLTATGVNTPGTAPKVQNPWATHPESLESQIFDAYTGANGKQQVPAGEIQRRFAGNPDEGKVAAVIAAANQLTQGNLMNGVPGPARLGAEVPNAPDISGLGYPNVGGGVPDVTTTPVPEPNVGFSGAPPAAQVDLPPPPTATPVASSVTIAERPAPKVPLKARGGVNIRVPEKAGPGRDVTITPPPPARSPQSMGPATKAPSTGAGAQLMSMNPLSAGFEAGRGVRQNVDDAGLAGLFKPKPGTGMDQLIRTIREHLGPTGADEVKIHRADPRSIYDMPELKGNEKLLGWNQVFKPWAQRMGYTTTDQVLSASKWYFEQEDRLRRPPYSLSQADAQKQLKVALESFASAPGKSIRLRVPKTGGPGNPRIGATSGPGPGTVEYRGKGR